MVGIVGNLGQGRADMGAHGPGSSLSRRSKTSAPGVVKSHRDISIMSRTFLRELQALRSCLRGASSQPQLSIVKVERTHCCATPSAMQRHACNPWHKLSLRPSKSTADTAGLKKAHLEESPCSRCDCSLSAPAFLLVSQQSTDFDGLETDRSCMLDWHRQLSLAHNATLQANSVPKRCANVWALSLSQYNSRLYRLGMRQAC